MLDWKTLSTIVARSSSAASAALLRDYEIIGEREVDR